MSIDQSPTFIKGVANMTRGHTDGITAQARALRTNGSTEALNGPF